jgi:hypothetical protein
MTPVKFKEIYSKRVLLKVFNPGLTLLSFGPNLRFISGLSLMLTDLTILNNISLKR